MTSRLPSAAKKGNTASSERGSYCSVVSGIVIAAQSDPQCNCRRSNGVSDRYCLLMLHAFRRQDYW
jgi:hypothetical protein